MYSYYRLFFFTFCNSTELQPEELKIEDGHEDAAHVVVSDISVPVSAEMEDGDHMASGSSIQSSLHMGAVATEADQEKHSHEGVSHILLTDILIPVCEDMKDDLSKERTTTGKRSPLVAERSQVSYLNGILGKEYYQIILMALVNIGY